MYKRIKTNDMINLFKKEKQLVAEIHNEFDTAQDRLLHQAESLLTELNISTESKMKAKAEMLESLGFINSAPVKWVKENSLVKTREQAELIKYYKQNYPFQKFLFESELERICRKYNLIFAPVSNYIKDVPEKNIKEICSAAVLKEADVRPNRKLLRIKKFWFNLPASIKEKLSGVLDLTGISEDEYNDLKRGHGDSVLKNHFGLNIHGYVFRSAESVEENVQGLFIAAPKSHFNLAGLKKTGRFSFLNVLTTEVKDPIVFRYVRGGVQVLSKWGLEAEDEKLVNEKLN